MMTRREVTAGLGVTFAGTTILASANGQIARAASIPSGEVDVLIIGAGVAGLAAAHQLRKSKLTTLVIEARDRIGGRTLTDTSTLGLPVDVGGQWLHNGTSNPLAKVAKRLGIGLAVSDRAEGWLFRDGARTDESAVAAYLAAERTLMVRAKALLKGCEDVSLADLARGDRWLELVAEQVAAADSAQDANRVSVQDVAAISLLRDLDYDVAGGLGALVAKWGQSVPVSFGAAVKSVDWSGPGVVATGDFGSIRARRAIVTVPTSLLSAGRIAFTPALPSETQASFSQLPMGLMLKVSLRLSRQIADLPPYGAELSIIEAGKPHAVHIHPSYPLVTMMVGGSLAWDLERAGKAAAVDLASEVLAGIAGGSARSLVTGSLVSGWGNDPWSLGAYTAAAVGHAQAREAYSTPVADRIWFAGEAGATDQASTVGGAYLSGQEAATQVRKSLTSRKEQTA